MKRVDANQSRVVKELRQLGVSVQSIAEVGDGCPDILCGFRGVNVVLEIKDWKQPVSKRRLSPKEKLWHEGWRGQVQTIETSAEAFSVIEIEVRKREPSNCEF